MAEVTSQCVWCERPARWTLVPGDTLCCSRHAVNVLCVEADDDGTWIVPVSAPPTPGIV